MKKGTGGAPLGSGEPGPEAPRIGLALGGGAARGWAHLGVIRALEEMGVDISLVAGTSFGSVVGAAYCTGAHGDLERFGRGIDLWKMFSFFEVSLLNRSGFSDGTRIERFFRENLDVVPIEEMDIPFYAVCCDLLSGERVVIDRGDTVFAVRASSSVPLMFTAIERDGRVLVDGGVVDPLPVDVCREKGADLVIAVDLNHYLPDGISRKGKAENRNRSPLLEKIDRMVPKRDLKETDLNMIEVLFSSFFQMSKHITNANLRICPADILVRPPLERVNYLDFHLANEAIEAGHIAAVERSGEIRNMLDHLHDRGSYKHCL